MKWVKNCNTVANPKLIHGKAYRVKLDNGHIMYAEFKVYVGGEEVAFVRETGQELSVTEIFI